MMRVRSWHIGILSWLALPKYLLGRTVCCKGTLTTAIGIFITYMTPTMMISDLLIGIVNQHKLISFFDRFKKVDERLARESIRCCNNALTLRIRALLAVTFLGECILAILSFYFFHDPRNLESLLVFVAAIPTLVTTIEKVWFASLLFALKERFEAVNTYLDQTVDNYVQKNRINEMLNDSDSWDLGYLHKEIFMKNPQYVSSVKKPNKIIPVVPWDETIPVKVYNEEKKPNPEQKESDLNDTLKMEVRLNGFCQIHDEICELGKLLNRMWSLQMLLLMAYGFMSITAQFYFLYCNIVNQNIPVLFRSARNVVISSIFIVYTAGKCVYVIYLSWQTKLEARKTGVCYHKIANAVDENNFYEIINHLSLKLLNHTVNFTACGFFDLDMTTLYSVTGAITSYLIILIQFNLAAHRTKRPDNNSLITTTSTQPTL
ncbi:unnamed protein product [Hermetia illucens]|uniref:Gustatory receptor n=1 Tax=Hermetia illucens TaxID=343691 RepID=A0A7R8UKU4_HERIL|nr:unnamed protein product [Hermetia illucens]